MERTRTKSSSAKTNSAVLGNLSLFVPALFGNTVFPQYLNIASFEIRYYSLFFVCAIIVAYFIARYFALKQGISQKDFEDISFWTLLVGFISARIFFVLFNLNYYFSEPLEIFKVWHGGLAIYGALIGGFFTILFFAKKRKLNFALIADSIALGLPIAQSIGRLGNLFNNEAFGKPTDLPWAIYIPEKFRPAAYQDYSYFHPTFLYEILWNILVFVLIYLLREKLVKKGLKPGLVALVYILLYSFGRFFIEGLRLDSLYLGNIRINQILALLLILGAFGIIISRYVSQNRK